MRRRCLNYLMFLLVLVLELLALIDVLCKLGRVALGLFLGHAFGLRRFCFWFKVPVYYASDGCNEDKGLCIGVVLRVVSSLVSRVSSLGLHLSSSHNCIVSPFSPIFSLMICCHQPEKEMIGYYKTTVMKEDCQLYVHQQA